MQKRIAIINQRYGGEVNGGSEYYTKQLAEHLNEVYDVEVLTTTALDYDTWAPYYEAGATIVDGVRVRRFDVDQVRNKAWFKFINKLMVFFPAGQRLLEPVWQRAQGPYCPALIEYICSVKDEYDLFIFITYLYYTTTAGLPKVAEKSLLVPTAHDEYCVYFPGYKKIFTKPKGIIYLTEEEKMFVERVFRNQDMLHVVAGTGIEISSKLKQRASQDFYLIYVGRVDTSKKCDVLFRYFSNYKDRYPGPLKLVVVGKEMMEVPVHNDIIYKGFIGEEEKHHLIANAIALVMPSEHESLSLSVLESMALGVPVIVNGNCPVLRAHCQISGAGLWYFDDNEFDQCVEQMVKGDEIYENRKRLALEYIEQNYSWKKTVNDFRRMIDCD